MAEILEATEQHIPGIAPLLNSYRVFYRKTSNLEAATHFLKERLSKKESILFIAIEGEQMIGFTQLYRSFSTVSLRPILILNDLYVKETHRRLGIGAALLNHAKNYCKKHNCKGLALETATDNPAQRLYERLGWEKDVHCFHYFWTA